MTKIDYKIDKNEKVSFIKDIRTCSNPYIIAIIVSQPKESDSILIWDIYDNFEREMFDTKKEYQIIWDKLGKAYVISDNQIYFAY